MERLELNWRRFAWSVLELDRIKKIETFKFDKNLRKLKYIILIVFVIILPLFLVDLLGQGSPYFCKLISPIGMLGLWELFIQLLAQFQYSGID